MLLVTLNGKREGLRRRAHRPERIDLAVRLFLPINGELSHAPEVCVRMLNCLTQVSRLRAPSRGRKRHDRSSAA